MFGVSRALVLSFLFYALTAVDSERLLAMQAGQAEFKLVNVTDGVQLIDPGGKVVFRFLTKKPEGIGLTSPSGAFFDPLNTPSGERVTNLAPDDHPHHRGMYFGFIDSEFLKYSAPASSASPYAPRTFSVQRADFFS